ncbi:MAG TPA: hypothetical protein VFS43_21645 [Polyangiaceae bacterium]|nr:hypothetical protein [Polyangiaceae bacterium]
MLITKTTYWLYWTSGGSRLGRPYEGEDEARAALAERLADPGASDVRLERLEPDVHSGRYAVWVLFPAPED